MFQYAAATGVANGRYPVYFDTDFYKHQKKRKLEILNLCVAIHQPPSWAAWVARQSLRRRVQLCRNRLSARLRTALFYEVVDRQCGYDPAVAAARGNRVMTGYFQSERYFSHLSTELRKQFKPRLLPSTDDEMVKRLMLEAWDKSVFVHVRRGDYVSDPTANAYHGVCGLGYYRAAAREIASRLGKPRFFVFGDDPQWIRENIDLREFGSSELVMHNIGSSGWADLNLMSYCHHAIIANSTFSWWGAWLSEVTPASRLVFAPKRWFASDALRSPDIVPDSWIRL